MSAEHFIFYGTFESQLEGLPEEMQNKFYRAIIRYGLHGEEPEFGNPLEAALFKQFKFAIDGQQSRKERMAENGKRGGRPRSKENLEKPSESKENLEKPSESKENLEKPSESKENLEKPSESKIAEKKRIEGEMEEEGEESAAAEAAYPPPSPSPPQEDYARAVFDLWKGAGLPCRNGNFLLFMQSDFMGALQYLRGTHSDSVLAAARNFVSVLADPRADDFWKRQRPTFERFCAGRLLSRFLPDNFSAEEYKRGLTAEEEREERRERERVAEEERRAAVDALYAAAPRDCPNCGGRLMYRQGMGTCVCGTWCERSADGSWEIYTKGG